MRRLPPFAKTGLVLLGLLMLTPGLSRPERKKAFVDHFLQQMIQGTASEVAKGAPAGTLSKDHQKHLERLVAMGTRGGVPVVHVRMRLDAEARDAVEHLGIKVYGRMDGFGSAIVPVARLKEIADLPGVEGMQAVRVLTKELDVSRAEVRSTATATAYGATGKGVIVGSVDTGVSWQQNDFRKPDGTTRIKFIWSQDDACVGTPPPAPFDFGCLYTEADINAALSGGPTITAPDADGHGTHTLGVSSGNGRATGNGFPAGRFVGMAPEADIIVVKTFPEPTDVTPCPGCFDISAGLDFIDAKAAELGEPYAINLSLGSQFGGHDGGDFDENTIDSLIGNGLPGKAIVKSAGNERGRAIHIGGTVTAGVTKSHTFTVPSYTPLSDTFNDAIAWQLWYAGGDRLTVSLDDPTTAPCTGAQTLSASTGIPGTGQAVNNSTSGRLYIDDIGSPAPNGARFFNMEVDDAGTQLPIPPAPCRGTWTLRVRGDTITAGGRYDAWIFFSSFGASGLEGLWVTPDNTRNISIPGTSFNGTTVGGYISKFSWPSIDTTCTGGPPCSYHFTASGAVGTLAWFSSSGPTRDGRLKPELSAPGSAVTSSLSTDVVRDANSNPYIDPDNQHQSLPGTSFSSPHVAGAFAQLLSLNPNLDAIDLRTLVTSTARVDANVTPAVPNNDWGYGKLDVKAAADLMIKAIPDLTASNNQTFGWTGIPTATTYNIYRGDLALVSPTYYGSCFATGLPTPIFTDPSIPVPGGGFFYLVTGVKDGVEGMLGFRSDGTPRPNLSACP